MYGSIYGDLAGSIYEFEQLKEIKSIDNGGYLSNKSFFSDDTILTVAVCAAIKDDKDYDKYLRKYIIDYMIEKRGTILNYIIKDIKISPRKVEKFKKDVLVMD